MPKIRTLLPSDNFNNKEGDDVERIKILNQIENSRNVKDEFAKAERECSVNLANLL
jgi:hypothetical protein